MPSLDHKFSNTSQCSNISWNSKERKADKNIVTLTETDQRSIWENAVFPQIPKIYDKKRKSAKD